MPAICAVAEILRERCYRCDFRALHLARADLLARGYDGGISMEPHLAVGHHDPTITPPDAIRFANYVEYGRRFERLLAEVRAGQSKRTISDSV